MTAKNVTLIGLAVDVSGSMREGIRNTRGAPQSRLEGVRSSISGYVDRLASSQAASGSEDAFALFALGFGFGNPVSRFFSLGDNAPVQSLLPDGGEMPVKEAAHVWPQIERHIESKVLNMGGATPMRAGLMKSLAQFESAWRGARAAPGGVLILVSDGEPTDATPEDVLAVADRIKSAGVMLIGCYVTSDDKVESRRLPTAVGTGWPLGAQLLFNCASELELDSEAAAIFGELNWKLERGSRLFAQVNQSELMAEFFAAFTPSAGTSSTGAQDLTQQSRAPAIQSAQPSIFLSYSRKDAEYVAHLHAYMDNPNAPYRVWIDKEIMPGDMWRERIAAEMAQATHAVMLISQNYLNSEFCNAVEIPYLTRAASAGRLTLIPVVLAPCTWQDHPLLREIQMFNADAPFSAIADDRTKRDAFLLRLVRSIFDRK